MDSTIPAPAHDSANLIRRREELILKSVGEGIYGLDSNGITTFVNPAAATLLGWSIEELIGRHQHTTLHHTRADGSPFDVEDCPIHATLRDGETREVSDDLFWRKDGTSFSVEYTCTGLWEEQRVVGAVVTFRDITERKQSEELDRERRRQTGSPPMSASP